MLDGLDHVRKAAGILVNRDGTLKDRLGEAIGEFAVSLIQPDEWPSHLLRVAQRVGERLKGVAEMNLGTAQQVAEELLSVASDVKAAFREESRGRIEWKGTCRVNKQYEGLANVVEQPYGERYRVWYGCVDVCCSQEQWYEMMWKDVLLALDDGRMGQARVLTGEAKETLVGH